VKFLLCPLSAMMLQTLLRLIKAEYWNLRPYSKSKLKLESNTIEIF